MPNTPDIGEGNYVPGSPEALRELSAGYDPSWTQLFTGRGWRRLTPEEAAAVQYALDPAELEAEAARVVTEAEEAFRASDLEEAFRTNPTMTSIRSQAANQVEELLRGLGQSDYEAVLGSVGNLRRRLADMERQQQEAQTDARNDHNTSSEERFNAQAAMGVFRNRTPRNERITTPFGDLRITSNPPSLYIAPVLLARIVSIGHYTIGTSRESLTIHWGATTQAFWFNNNPGVTYTMGELTPDTQAALMALLAGLLDNSVAKNKDKETPSESRALPPLSVDIQRPRRQIIRRKTTE